MQIPPPTFKIPQFTPFFVTPPPQPTEPEPFLTETIELKSRWIEHNINYHVDDCNFYVQTSSQLNIEGLVTQASPTFEFHYRNPTCSLYNPPITKKLDREPIQIPYVERGAWVNINWNTEYYHDGRNDFGGSYPGEGWKYDEINIELINVKYPVEFRRFYEGIEITLKINYRSRKSDRWIPTATAQELHNSNREWVHTYKVWENFQQTAEGFSYISVQNSGEYYLFAPDLVKPIAYVYLDEFRDKIVNVWGENATSFTRNPQPSDLIATSQIIDGVKYTNQPVSVTTPIRSYEISPYGFGGVDIFAPYWRYRIERQSFITYTWQVLAFIKDWIPQYQPPPPPDIPKKDDDMSCCEELKPLLYLLLKRVGSLPVRVPASFLTKNDEQPQNKTDIESITDFIAWFAERFDEVLGEYEIKIDIEDTDLTQEGNQGTTIRLPNLAEAIAEIFTLQMQAQMTTGLILNITNRILLEQGTLKQTELKSYNAIMALVEYMGFPTKTITQKMPLLYKPGEKEFDKLLKESEIDVSVIDYQEKDSFLPALQTLLQSAAIIRAVHYRRLPNNFKGMQKQLQDDLLKIIGDNEGLTEDIKKYLEKLNKSYEGTGNAG